MGMQANKEAMLLLRTVLSTMLPNRWSSTFVGLAGLTATWCGHRWRGRWATVRSSASVSTQCQHFVHCLALCPLAALGYFSRRFSGINDTYKNTSLLLFLLFQRALH